MNELEQRQSKRVLPIASVVTFLAFLDTPLLIPVMALYAAELGASVGAIGLIIGLYSITNTPANILFGRLIDRMGYKAPLIAGLVGDALAMFFYSLARLPLHLALVRAYHGVSGGLVGPATMSVVAEYSARTGKSRAMGFYGMSLAAATLVGYVLSGIVIAPRLGYKAVFLFGTALLAIGMALSLALPSRERRGSKVARTSSSEALGQIKSLFDRKKLNVSYTSIFAQYFTFGGVVTLLPVHVSKLGMEVFHFGMLLAIFSIMFIIVQFPSSALSDKVGRLIPTIGGLSLGMISLVMLPALTTFPQLAAVMALYGVAFGALFTSISALVADHTNLEERGLATGMFHALLTAGVAIGAPIMGWTGEVIGIEWGLVLCSGIMILALVVALRSLRRA